MSDPLSFVPLALAAGGGRIGQFDAPQLVAAGVTLLQRSAPLVRALASHRSAILLPTSPAFITALAASDGRGAVLINPFASATEIEWQIRDANVGALFTLSTFLKRLPADVVTVLLDDAPTSARVLANGRDATIDLGSHFGLSLEGDRETEGSNEEFAVVYTSAMEGIARGARLTHRNVLSNAHATTIAAQITPLDHSLAILPFSHMFGLAVAGAAPLLTGARVTTMDRFNPVRALDIIASEGVTIVSGVPAMFISMLQIIVKRGVPFNSHHLRACICGGAPLEREVQEMWQQYTGVPLRQGYGLTEAGPVCLFNSVTNNNVVGTLGTPFPGVEVSVRDIGNGYELPNGHEGELCVRGPNVFAGYVNNATDALQSRDGWLRTGDLSVRNDDGTFSFRGLCKNMFTRNGFNIYPREIERVVGLMPNVTSVKATALPDSGKENNIAISVSGSVSEDSVRAWCELYLSAYKQPSLITVTE